MFRFLCLCVFLVCQTMASNGDDIAAFLGHQQKRAQSDQMDDLSFLRVLYLDVIGKTPTPEQVNAFLNDNRVNKRALLVEELIQSQAFTYRWSAFFDDMFQPQGLEVLLRNGLNDFFIDQIGRGEPVDQMIRDLLTANGRLANESGKAIRFMAVNLRDATFHLDSVDDQIDRITSLTLGVKVNCISCHDGAYHLEDVNKGLSTMTRQQFWGMAAFLSKGMVYRYDQSSFSAPEKALAIFDLDEGRPLPPGDFLISDERYHDGEYHADTLLGDGMRPPRTGGTIQPAYMTHGEGVLPGENRREALARHITNDRQFARNMVNRLWAHFFGEGFVEPLNGWDLGRLDEVTAASFNTTVLARNPDLVEYLASLFIDSGYDLRFMIRYITNSWLYGAKAYPGPGYGNPDAPLHHWRVAKHGRRISAEAIAEAFFDILGEDRKYMVSGREESTYHTLWALPADHGPALIDAQVTADLERGGLYSSEIIENLFGTREEYERNHEHTFTMMALLGRGVSYLNIARIEESNAKGLLLLMNDPHLQERFYSPNPAPLVQEFINDYSGSATTPGVFVDALFRRVLFRNPNAEEQALFIGHLQSGQPSQTIPQMVWALFNHPDFIYK